MRKAALASLLAVTALVCASCTGPSGKPASPRSQKVQKQEKSPSLPNQATPGRPELPKGWSVPSSWLTGVVFVSSSRGFALTRAADTGGVTELAESVNSGRSWRVLATHVPGGPTHLDFFNEKIGYAWGADLAVTQDGGLEWTITLHGDPSVAGVVPFSPTRAWALRGSPEETRGSGDTHQKDVPLEVLSTTDSGLLWHHLPSEPGLLSLTDIPHDKSALWPAELSMVSAKSAYVLGLGQGSIPQVGRGSQGGSPPSSEGGSASAQGPFRLVAALTNDSGRTWAYVPIPCGLGSPSFANHALLPAAHVVAMEHGVLWLACNSQAGPGSVGYHEIWRSLDGGVTFTKVSSGPGEVASIAVVSPIHAWIALAGTNNKGEAGLPSQGNSTLKVTTNGGRTWTAVSGDLIKAKGGFSQVTMFSSKVGWALGPSGLWFTSNGTTWTLVDPSRS
jgi:hypothetical protein